MIIIHTMCFMQSYARKRNVRKHILETKRMLKLRLADHCGYVRNQTLDKATGEHFILSCHSLSDLSITVIEQSKINKKKMYKKRKEKNTT